MAERLFARANVIPVLDTVPREFLGEGGLLTGIALENVKTKKTSLLSCAGAFIAIGRVPNSNFAGDVLPRDGSGHFLGIPPDFVSTPVPGIFLAGDCQDRAYRQAIVAAGAGCKAALCAEKWLRGGD
jgi:thioredoxin reductase (NADPH)